MAVDVEMDELRHRGRKEEIKRLRDWRFEIRYYSGKKLGGLAFTKTISR